MHLDPTLDAVNCGYVPKRYLFVRAFHANPTTLATSLSGSGAAPGLYNQVLYPFADLGTNTGPVVNTFEVKTQTLFLATRQRVEKPDSFNTTSITLAAGICYHDVVERPLFSATARQSNLYHSIKPFYKNKIFGRIFTVDPLSNQTKPTTDTGTQTCFR
jgi:hypothetical protein